MQKWLEIPAENLLMILMVIVGVGFVITWLLGSRGGGIRNKTVINGKHNKVVNTQIDKSVKLTEINTHVHVRSPAPEVPKPRRAPQSGEPETNFVLFGVVTLFLAIVYIRFFEFFTLASIALCALVVGASLALLVLSATRAFGDGLAASLRAAFLLTLSLGSGWFLYDGQQMVDPRLVHAAQSAPWTTEALIGLLKLAWRTSLWNTALASTVICALCMLIAVQGLLFARRIGAAGFLAARLDEDTYRQYACMPTWRSMSTMAGGIVLLALVRFVWLPQALLSK